MASLSEELNKQYSRRSSTTQKGFIEMPAIQKRKSAPKKVPNEPLPPLPSSEEGGFDYNDPRRNVRATDNSGLPREPSASNHMAPYETLADPQHGDLATNPQRGETSHLDERVEYEIIERFMAERRINKNTLREWVERNLPSTRAPQRQTGLKDHHPDNTTRPSREQITPDPCRISSEEAAGFSSALRIAASRQPTPCPPSGRHEGPTNGERQGENSRSRGRNTPFLRERRFEARHNVRANKLANRHFDRSETSEGNPSEEDGDDLNHSGRQGHRGQSVSHAHGSSVHQGYNSRGAPSVNGRGYEENRERERAVEAQLPLVVE